MKRALSALSQVWTLRSETSYQDLKKEAASKQTCGEREDLLTFHGYNHLEHALSDIDGVESTHCPMDLTHVEFEGNAKVHIPAFIFMIVVVFKWCTLEQVNAEVSYLVASSD